jgi:glutamate synthase (NADPH/NADH) small chain
MDDKAPMPDSGNRKHAWVELDRCSPPKRKAAERVKDFDEIYDSYDEQTVMEQARRCINCPDALCMEGCPLENRIPEWMLLTAEGRFSEAAVISQSTSSMPEICARICPQDRLCEGACVVAGKAEAISIGAVERFINEWAFARGEVVARPVPPNGMKVAVVGGGPGGLACADQLARRGYAVTVFEASTVAGGLLMNGIPAFKLEKHVVERRINVIKQRGVKFRTGVKVGVDIKLYELEEQFDAIFLAFGAQMSKELGVPGSDLEGVIPALPYLIQKNTNTPVDLDPVEVAGKKVIVVGGGDTAMDCLRTSLRCGASEVRCVYRRDESNMPGSRKEYENSLEEGAKFTFLGAPVEVLGDDQGRVKALRCVRMELGPADASGRRRPQPVPGSEHDLPADIILVAFGFDAFPFPEGSGFEKIKTSRWGTVVVDDNLMTNVPGIFCGGDLYRGPDLVVRAVRDGRDAAAAIHAHLVSHRLMDMSVEQPENVGMEVV